MSSTSNSQNLLVNVFRPTYVYDVSKGYIPKLVVSNVDSVVGTSGTFSSLNVGDAKNNVYIGKDAGNPAILAIDCNSSNITAIGLNAGQSNATSSNSVFVGNAAGFNACNVTRSIYLGESNGFANRDCTNSVYIGFNATKNLSNASNEIAIGANTIAGGQSNIYIGPSTGSAGSRNIFIGPDISGTSTVSNQLRIGRGSNIAIFGDLSKNRVSINTTDSSADFHVKGNSFFDGNVGIRMSDPTYALTVKGQVYSTDGIRINANGISNPNIALADNPSTGIYGDVSNGNYSLGFAVAGTNRLLMIDSSFIVNANLQVNGTFGIATSLGSNIVATSSIRMPDSNGGDLDISGGNIKVLKTLTTGYGSIQLGNGFITDTCTNGYIRMLNSSSVAQIDLSGGNMSNSGLIRTRDISASGFIRVGGTDISGGNISNASLIRTQDISASGFIRVAGTDISGGNISNASLIGTQDISASGYIRVGGTDISGGNISNATLIRTQDISASGYIRVGGTDINGGNISNALRITTRDISTLQTFESFVSGVRFSNRNITSDPAGSSSIGGVTLSNGTISNASTSSNRIGGIDLSGARLLALDTTKTHIIGGVTITQSNISNDSTTSNSIGGVTLTNNALTASGSNLLGGVTLNGNGLTFSGILNGTDTAQTHTVGGVRFSNGITKGFALGNMSANSSQALFIENSTTSNGIYLLKGGDNNYGGLSVRTNVGSGSSAERMRIDPNTGNVGIGATSPGAILEVAKSGTGTTSDIRISAGLDGSASSANVSRLTFNIKNAAGGVSTNNVQMDTIGSTVGLTYLNSNGAPYVRMDSTNSRVGIGTTAPVASLDISGDISGSSNIKLAAGTAAAPTYTFSSDLATGIYSAGTNQLAFSTIGLQRMCISGTNVGIGTTAPSTFLEITGSATVPQLLVRNLTPTAAAGITVLGNALTNQANGLRLFHDINEMGLYSSNATLPLRFFTNNIPRMTINSAGNVGIGITAPLYVLDVSCSVGAATTVISARNTLSEANIAVLGQSTTEANALKLVQNATWQGLYALNTLPMRFYTSNNSRLSILSNGNVGIGTDTPGYTLDVNGTIAANSNEYTVYVTTVGSNIISVPTGFTKAFITLVGAGGGGGGGYFVAGVGGGGGGGGGAGWLIEQIITPLTTTITVEIGAGGTGGNGTAPGGNGTAGGASYAYPSPPYLWQIGAPGGSGGSGGSIFVGGAGASGYYSGGGGGGFGTNGGGAAGATVAGRSTILTGSAGQIGTVVAGVNSGGPGGNGGGGYNTSIGGSGANGGGGGGSGGGGGGGNGGNGSGDQSTRNGKTSQAGCGGGGGGGAGNSAFVGNGGNGGDGYAILKFLR